MIELFIINKLHKEKVLNNHSRIVTPSDRLNFTPSDRLDFTPSDRMDFTPSDTSDFTPSDRFDLFSYGGQNTVPEGLMQDFSLWGTGG